MTRPAAGIAALFILGAGTGGYARLHKSEELLNPVQGLKINSRITCDGSTNFQEEVLFATTFSPGGGQRSFHLDVFQSKYCRRVDLYFVCVVHGHDRWKHAWSHDSEAGTGNDRYWLDSCSNHEAKDAPQYVLSGWYQEEAPGRKPLWKQAAIKQVSEKPETYEFNDPNGGTARLEIKRR